MIKKGFDVILHAPTGGGKTIGGFMPSIDDFINNNYKSQEFHTLYISPLKALTTDVQRNLLNPINDLKINIKVETRTSDTSTYNKAKQIKKPPNFLMTTPESFALLMARTDVINLFKNLKFVIIDELHTFFDSKRGHLLSLNLARLRSIKPFQVIGLSATLKNTSLAKKYLSNNKNTKLVSTHSKVAPEITILNSGNRIPWSGHSPRYALSEIYSEILKFKSSILFVNTRAQAEILFESLWAINNKNKKILFACDTGYGEIYKKLGEKFGPVDLTMINIGAYDFRPMFEKSIYHTNPEEALQVAKDLKSRKVIGTHWGTFVLSLEPIMEPPVRFKNNAEKYGFQKKDAIIFKIGEIRPLQEILD